MHSLGSRLTGTPPGTFGASQAGRPPTQGHALRTLGHLSGHHPSEAGAFAQKPRGAQTASDRSWQEGGEGGQGRAVLNCFVSCQNPGFLSFPSPDFQHNSVDFDPFERIFFTGGILLSQSNVHSYVSLGQYKQ